MKKDKKQIIPKNPPLSFQFCVHPTEKFSSEQIAEKQSGLGGSAIYQYTLNGKSGRTCREVGGNNDYLFYSFNSNTTFTVTR